MSHPMDDERFDAALRRFLVWEADQAAGAPSVEEVASRIAARLRQARRWTWMPVSRRVAIVFGVALMLATLIGLIAILSGPPFPSPEVRNGGIVVARGCSLGLLDPATGSITELVVSPPGCGRVPLGGSGGGSGSSNFASPVWSADGTRMAYSIHCVACDDAEYLADLGGAWLFDVATGQNRQLMECVDPQRCIGTTAISPDGSRVAYFSSDRNARGSLFILDPDGSAPIQIEVDSPYWTAAFSPDGERLAFTARHWPLGERVASLYVSGADGSGVTRLVERAGVVMQSPSWSPDGNQIAYEVWAYGTEATTISVVDADGSNAQDLATSDGTEYLGFPAWSRDGQRIIYRTDPRFGGPVEVWAINPDGTGQTLVYSTGCCPYEVSGIVWSPDGRFLAISMVGDSVDEIGVFVVRPDGSDLRRVLTSAYSVLSWQPIR